MLKLGKSAKRCVQAAWIVAASMSLAACSSCDENTADSQPAPSANAFVGPATSGGPHVGRMSRPVFAIDAQAPQQ